MDASAHKLSDMTISVRSTQTAGRDPQLQAIADETTPQGMPIQVRIVPQLYRPSDKRYIGWRELSWNVGVPTVEEAEQLKAALGEFFGVVATGQLEHLIEALKAIKAGAQA